MSSFYGQVGCLQIKKIKKDLNIECLAHKIKLHSNVIPNMNSFYLGSERFHDSVNTCSIDYMLYHANSDIKVHLDYVKELFKNIKPKKFRTSEG